MRLSLVCGIAALVPTLLASVLVGATIRTHVEPELAPRLIADVERLLLGLGLALSGVFALLGWALARGLGDLLRTASSQEIELRGEKETLERRVRERTTGLHSVSLAAQRCERAEHAAIVIDASGRAASVNDTSIRDCRPYPAAVDARTVRDDEGAMLGFVAFKGDATDRRDRQDRLRHEALHDMLTGLPNRVLFHDRMAHAARRATREPADGFAVLHLRIDGFEAIDEHLGHAFGDQLLVAATRLLEANMRPGDSVARLGDDEFGVLLDRVRSVTAATRVAERILERFGEPIDLDGHTVRVSASIGIALSDAGGIRFEDTLRGADAARCRAIAGFAVFDTLTDGAALAHGSRRSSAARPGRLAS